MASALFRKITALELEEQILNGSALLGAIGVFLPWIGGEWLGGNAVNFTGLGFYTSFLGWCILALLVFILLMTLVPLTGGPVLIRKAHRETVRLNCAALSAILVLASLSVLTKVTFEFSRMEVRFGIYVTLIGTLTATLYAFLRHQEERRKGAREFFYHPEDIRPVEHQQDFGRIAPPPPPPPPPQEPEDHRLHP